MTVLWQYAKLFETLKVIFWWVIQFLGFGVKQIHIPLRKTNMEAENHPFEKEINFWVRSGSALERYSLLMFPALKMPVPQWKSKCLRYLTLPKKKQRTRGLLLVSTLGAWESLCKPESACTDGFFWVATDLTTQSLFFCSSHCWMKSCSSWAC